MKKSHVATQLSRQAVRSVTSWRAADDARLPTAEHHDRLNALAAEASFHPAGSGEGVMSHLAGLGALIDLHFADDQAARQALRHLEHVVCFTEDTTCTSRGAFAGWSLEERKDEGALAA